MPFESKDIRAVYDSLTADPLFRNMNKPFEEWEVQDPKFNVPVVTRSRSGFRQEQLDAYKESRRKRLEEMYSKSK